jgi:hypothetical protein
MKPIVKSALLSGGSAIGGVLGNKIGMGVQGAAVGQDLAARLSRLIGSGDYETNSCSCNSLIKGGPQQAAYAAFGSSSQGVVVKHRDYISDVFTSGTAGAFSINAIPVNPGLSYFVPYLAQIAQNFEMYRVRGMAFEFISTAPEYSTVQGSVILAMEYNAAAPAFTSKPQMENSDFAISARFDKDCIYGVECANSAQTMYYVRSGGSSLPVTTTDLGVFYVATQPGATYATNSSIGELWVTYDIEFLRPRVSPARFGYYHAWGAQTLATAAYVNMATACTSSTIYGTLTGTYLTSGTNGSFAIYFPNANVGDTYFVSLTTSSSGVFASGNFNSTTSSAVSFVPFFDQGAVAKVGGAAGSSNSASNSVVLWVGVFTITIEGDPGMVPSVQWAIGTTGVKTSAADVASCDIVVIDIGNGFYSSNL